MKVIIYTLEIKILRKLKMFCIYNETFILKKKPSWTYGGNMISRYMKRKVNPVCYIQFSVVSCIYQLWTHDCGSSIHYIWTCLDYFDLGRSYYFYIFMWS